MRPIVATLLLALALPALAAARKPESAKRALPAMSPVARRYALRHEALLKEYSGRRRALVDSPRWRTLTPGEQAAELDALVAGYKVRDAKIDADYDAALSREGRRADAEAARKEQARRAGFDQVQRQAAQDALRAKQGR